MNTPVTPPPRREPRRPRAPSTSQPFAPRIAVLAIALLTALTSAVPLLANGGIVRFSREAVGPYRVTVYSSPTPLRTGELDVSVLVQDTLDAILDVPVTVEARPVSLAEGAEGPAASVSSIRLTATRAQATNKLFKAAKFPVNAPGEWSFRIEVADAGALEFRADVARTTILDRPWLLAVLVLLPLAVAGWFLLGRDDEEEGVAAG